MPFKTPLNSLDDAPKKCFFLYILVHAAVLHQNAASHVIKGMQGFLSGSKSLSLLVMTSILAAFKF